jgi:hypothetical protein
MAGQAGTSRATLAHPQGQPDQSAAITIDAF